MGHYSAPVSLIPGSVNSANRRTKNFRRHDNPSDASSADQRPSPEIMAGDPDGDRQAGHGNSFGQPVAWAGWEKARQAEGRAGSWKLVLCEFDIANIKRYVAILRSATQYVITLRLSYRKH